MKYKSCLAFSFGSSEKCTLEKNDKLYTPGPGAYSPRLISKKPPTYKIGKSKRKELVQDNMDPGPGQYNIPMKFLNGPKYSLISKHYYSNEKELARFPGPGQYHAIKLLNKNYKYSFGIKHKKPEIDETPGPGSYRISSSLSHIGTKFDKSQKNVLLDYTKNNPGPGKYNIEERKNSGQKCIFLKGKRIDFFKESDTPGPGAYNIENYVKGKNPQKITMGRKYSSLFGHRFDPPGPGAYNTTNINFYKKKEPAIKMCKSERQFITSASTQSNFFNAEKLGPGQYNDLNSYNYIIKRCPSCKFGKAERQPLRRIDKNIPPIGKYNIKRELGSASPKYSMRSKLQENFINLPNENPGPGTYEQINFAYIFKKSPRWKIGTGLRDDIMRKRIRENIPGPGCYNTILNNTVTGSKGFGFGLDKKGLEFDSDTPGPGSYHIPCTIMNVNNYIREKGKYDDNFKFI